MQQVSKYFKRKEFACKCGCGFDTVDVDLLRVLEDVREWFNSPVSINSACRCTTHNKKVGGRESSQHLKGRASDIVVKGITPEEVYEYIDSKYIDTLGLGSYNTFTHIDSRSYKARW